MAIHNRKQALAQECIERLGDRKKKAFGLYMGLISKFGENKVRQIMAEVNYQFKRGYINNKVRVFMYLLKDKKL